MECANAMGNTLCTHFVERSFFSDGALLRCGQLLASK